MKAAKFKKGQIVRIKKIEDIHNKYTHPTFVGDMAAYCDTDGKIASVFENKSKSPSWDYRIHGWTWREDWLCELEFLTDNDFEI